MRLGIERGVLNFTSQYAHDAHEVMSKICGYHLLNTQAKHTLDFRYQGIILPTNRIGIGTIQYGADVCIDISTLKSYSVSLPFSGKQYLTHNGITYQSDSNSAIIVSNSSEQSLYIEKNCQKFQFVIPEHKLFNVLSSLITTPIVEPVTFSPIMQIDNHSLNQIWWQNIELFVKNQVITGNPNLHFWSEAYEDFIIKGLLLSQEHNYSKAIEQKLLTIEPEYLIKAKQLITQYAKDAISIDDICRQVGVSKSKLYEEFRHYYGISPMNFLKNYRLEQVNKALLTTQTTSVSISLLAYEWGFNHLGRFSQEYRKRFGETPRETLRN